MESLAEVIGFLGHERAEVRQMAIESIAGLSLDEAVQAQVANHPEYLSSISRLLADQPLIAMNAWKVLVNLSKNQKICANLYEHLDRVIASVLDERSVFADYASMLLANISQHEHCHLAICEHLPRLLNVFIMGREYNPKASYDFIGNVLARVSTCAEGRKYFLANGSEAFFRILSQTLSSQLIRRGGAVSTIKNCLFESEQHEAIFAADADDDRLLGHLLALLVGPKSEFDQEDLDEMVLLDIQLEHRHTPAETDASIRALVMESLILIGTTRQGRDMMRDRKVYTILREWHKQEPVEALVELCEKAVELLIRDESGY